MSITDNNRSVEQKATAPRPVGSGQATRVPTHEGSLLSSPSIAKNTEGGNIIK